MVDLDIIVVDIFFEIFGLFDYIEVFVVFGFNYYFERDIIIGIFLFFFVILFRDR